mgnify:CR=1 FL=1
MILISDTFTEFAAPLMKKLGYPTLFCNSLEVADDGEITGFKMRVEQSKLTTVKHCSLSDSKRSQAAIPIMISA